MGMPVFVGTLCVKIRPQMKPMILFGAFAVDLTIPKINVSFYCT